MVCEKGLPMASCPDPAPWANWGEGSVLGLGAGPGWSFGSSPISPGGGGEPPLNQGAEEWWEALAVQGFHPF